MRSAGWLAGLVVLGGLSGCRGDRRVETGQARIPVRDLTQPAEPAAVTVASPVELGRARARTTADHPNRATHTRALVRKTHPAAAAPAPLPVIAPVPAVMKAISGPVAPSAEPDRGIGHELAPGETITIIPASSGTATEIGDEGDDRVHSTGGGIFIGGGRGGTCRPRGGVRGFRHTF